MRINFVSNEFSFLQRYLVSNVLYLFQASVASGKYIKFAMPPARDQLLWYLQKFHYTLITAAELAKRYLVSLYSCLVTFDIRALSVPNQRYFEQTSRYQEQSNKKCQLRFKE